MGITITSIADNEYFEHIGAVHVSGSIGKNVTLVITNGILTVDGDIGDDTNINLKQTNAYDQDDGIIVGGNISDRVVITAQNANFIVGGSIGTHCHLTAENGDISTSNVGKHSTLSTNTGHITTGHMDEYARLHVGKGTAKAIHLSGHAAVNIQNGSLTLTSAADEANIKVLNGDVIINMIKQNNNSRYQRNTMFPRYQPAPELYLEEMSERQFKALTLLQRRKFHEDERKRLSNAILELDQRDPQYAKAASEFYDKSFRDGSRKYDYQTCKAISRATALITTPVLTPQNIINPDLAPRIQAFAESMEGLKKLSFHRAILATGMALLAAALLAAFVGCMFAIPLSLGLSVTGIVVTGLAYVTTGTLAFTSAWDSFNSRRLANTMQPLITIAETSAGMSMRK